MDNFNKIKKDLINIQGCELADIRRKAKMQAVIGSGDLKAKIIFIGEAPGKKESQTGEPFCGASGKMLDNLLKSIKLDRNSVYITNVVKDRPPKNRDPKKQEIEVYAPLLDRQIALIKPNLIVTLGRFSMEYIIERYTKIEKIDKISEMKAKALNAELENHKFKVLPLFHPAVAIYNRKRLPELEKDFKLIKKYAK